MPNTNADSPDEPLVAKVYGLSGLPVWRLDDKGDPEFDTTLLVDYIKSVVGSGVHISASDDSLVVVATERNHSKVYEIMCRLWAFAERNVAERLKQRLSDSIYADQQVLLFVADPNCSATHVFFDAQFDDEHHAFQSVLANSLVQCVRTKQADVLKEWELTLPRRRDGLTVAVLSPDGRLVAQAASDRLLQDGHLNLTALTEFLAAHRTAFPDAKEELKSACEVAARNDRHVLLQLGGPSCIHCVRLSRFLERQQELISKDYVHLKLDTRMGHARELIAELRGKSDGPIPWLAVLAADGRVLITGDTDEGNIGYPQSGAGKAHFERMIRSTARHLSGSEVDSIISELGPTRELHQKASSPVTPEAPNVR